MDAATSLANIVMEITNMYIQTETTTRILFFFIFLGILLYLFMFTDRGIFTIIFVIGGWLFLWYMIFGPSQILSSNNTSQPITIVHNMSYLNNNSSIYIINNKTNLSLNKQNIFSDDLNLNDLGDI